MPQHGYRVAAVDARLALHRERLDALDDEIESMPSSRRLPRTLKSRLEELREAAEPNDESVQALCVAEQAADDYERTLDEALGLGAELRKSVEPLLPRGDVLLRWAGFAALSLSVLVLTVHQVGLDDFMMRAFGVKVQKADNDLTTVQPIRQTAALYAPAPIGEPAAKKPVSTSPRK